MARETNPAHPAPDQGGTPMKYVKILSLAAVAAMALMAFAASSASATALYSGGTKLGAGSTIDFSIPSGKTAVLVDTTGEELDTCASSTVKGTLSTATTGSIEELTWGSCTFPTKTVSTGNKLEVTGGTNTEGTVKADSTIEVTINTIFFGSCIYGVTSGTSVGTIKGNPATFTANAVAEKFTGSNLACPSTSKWTGNYSSTSPAELHVETE
jgi:hypothetical protein